jgi:hypothetical protein
MSADSVAVTLRWAAAQGFAKVMVVGEMPDGRTVIGHDASLEEIRDTLRRASESLDLMASRTLPPPR